MGQLLDSVLHHAFQVFDTNGNGVISLEEFSAIVAGDGPLSSVLPEGCSVEEAFSQVDLSRDGVITLAEFKKCLASMTSSGRGSKPTVEVDASEPLEALLRRISTKIGRSEEECAHIGMLLSEKHWLRTVSDLCNLRDAEWARLGLPVKLESVLHAYVDSVAPSLARETAAEATVVNQQLRAQSVPSRGYAADASAVQSFSALGTAM